jgi:hypothetical protein
MTLAFIYIFTHKLSNIFIDAYKEVWKNISTVIIENCSYFRTTVRKKQKQKISNTKKLTSKRLIQFCISHIETTEETPP